MPPEDGPGDREEPAAVYRRLREPLLRFFGRRVGDRAEVEDLTQQVFMRLLGARETETIENIDAFAFRIATNLLHDRGRAHVRRPEVVQDFTAPGAEGTRHLVEDISPERVFVGRETLGEVLATLDELGERTRDIFVLFRIEKMKQRDIAALYGIGQSTVEKHVMKAVLHLTRKYGLD
ncbi:RNA polymerase sigma factor [Caulobacter mirabilis]|uniref:RNA polymerase subunit sigma-24 n=1 Tax=Caulobacter mirabilis TaxID=69666 RepID=A0A2D2B2X9_9CAUL|nr:sigma-70 family RNA polymerase sigma factor [Caulobacter mirabilis]ATQ44609.1 RNA polymerase subunit sigma-24 [Caulobacter mirabilis]